MLESYQGEREILPASLWPGLVLGGAAVKAWQTAQSRNRLGMHLESLRGTWLPGLNSSAEDLEALQQRAILYKRKALRRVLSGVTLNLTGCWVPDADTVDALEEAAKLDTNSTPLEDMSAEGRAKIQMCDTEGCQYPRHFDATYSVPSDRRALLHPNPQLFIQNPSGTLETIIGDTLPSVEESRAKLKEFQRACSPYVGPRETLLTTGGIAQLSLIPETGCWFTRSYFMTPMGVHGYENWQYDGYGRLRVPSHLSGRYADFPTYAILAHRVTWLLSGRTLEKNRVLNHMCGFRPCANPQHLEQVTTRQNNEHGYAMKCALAEVESKQSRLF